MLAPQHSSVCTYSVLVTHITAYHLWEKTAASTICVQVYIPYVIDIVVLVLQRRVERLPWAVAKSATFIAEFSGTRESARPRPPTVSFSWYVTLKKWELKKRPRTRPISFQTRV